LNRAQKAGDQPIMARWRVTYSGTALLKPLAQLVDLGIRSIIFIVPAAIVAYWCDVQPTWKLFAFVAFCSFWSSVVFGAKEDSIRQDDRPVVKRTVEVMPPAQVAAEARKSTREVPAHPDASEPGGDSRS
jgi:hypothetical protein